MTSLDPRRTGDAHRGELVRGHGSIENQLAWRLDVSFADDAALVRKDHGLENLGAIKRHVRDLVRRSLPEASPLKAKRTSLKTRRYPCILDDQSLIRTLTASGEG